MVQTQSNFLSFFSLSDYEIVTVTGDRALAGTDSNVFITIYGKTGATQKMHLKAKNANTFQQGRSDTFKVHANCVGPLKRIRIEHDNKGLAPGWFLERVRLYFSVFMRKGTLALCIL